MSDLMKGSIKMLHNGEEWIRISDHVKFMQSIESHNDKIIKNLQEELRQQRFNNEHNLSIDQKVSDEIAKLKEQVKVLKEACEDIVHGGCPVENGCVSYEQCNCDLNKAEEALKKIEEIK